MRAGSPPPYVGPPPVPKMPAGLVDLVEGLTREVLKNNPKNVYEFCAKHLEKLLESRDGSSFKKPMLTLEQKILEAQEKVRQKAKERRERYDREMNARSLNTEQPTTELQNLTNNTLKSESIVSIINAMPPVHHEEGLKPDSEVEIAQKSFYIADKENTTNVENVETKKEEVEVLPEAVALIVSDSNTDLTHEKDISKENPMNAETTVPKKADDDKAVDNINANNIGVNILKVTDDVAKTPIKLQGQDIVFNVTGDSGTTHRENSLKDENKSVPITQSLKEENMASDNSNKSDNSLSSAAAVSEIKNDSYGTMTLNKNISTKKSDELQRETDELTVTEPPTVKDETKSNKDEAPFTENKLDDLKQAESGENIKKEENNERVIEINLLGAQEVDTLSENREGILKINVLGQDISKDNLTVPNETMSVIVNTPNISRNTSNKVITDIELNSIKDDSNDETLNSNDTVVVPEPVDTHKNMTTLDKEKIDNGLDTTAKVEEPVHTQKNMTTLETGKNNDNCDKSSKIEEEIQKLAEKSGPETASTKLDISNTSKSDANVTEHTKENVKEVASKEDKETPIQEKEQTDHDNPSIQGCEDLAIVGDDTSGLVTSDLSKIEEDTTGENQNDQNNMDLEKAAVTIQKVFRTFLFKSRNSTFDDGTNDEGTSLDDDSDNINKKEEYYAAANLNKERRPLGISRMDTVLQTVNEEKSLSLSTDDSSTLSSAATTIQAHVRGFLVRNRLNSNKTVSTNSVNSNEFLEPDTEQQKNKTVLNIHIVPEEGNYLSRDESIITSMELSLDGSPPSSVNLHPLSFDVSERRKLLKREDAIQSISPPSNNSGKLSEESVKELFINDQTAEGNLELETYKSSEEAVEPNNDSGVDSEAVSISSTATATTIINVTDLTIHNSPEHKKSKSLQNSDHDESDVVTPYVRSPRSDSGDYDSSSKLVHSGEFHDALLPTRVTRNDTTVVRGE